MEANLLRFILFVLGICLIVGIYLWDRHKRVTRRLKQVKRQDSPTMDMSEYFDEPDPDNSGDEYEGYDVDDSAVVSADPLRRREPSLSPAAVADEAVAVDTRVTERSVSEPASISMTASPVDVPETIPSMPVDETGETSQQVSGSELPNDVPTHIIQINILARSTPFEAAEIWQCARDTELEFGDMQIFHRYAAGGGKKICFSMASMFEPGVLPDTPDAFYETRGLILFGQFPGPEDSMAVFSDMLFTAERIAAMLNGELQDANHADLNKQTIAYMRGELLEHKRKVQLAMKQHA